MNKSAKIPIRKLDTYLSEPALSENFLIRDLKDMLAGKDLVQDLHRHDYFFILVLERGAGDHEIDFVKYKIHDRSIFILRPGQVHQIKLKAVSTGYLLQFKPDFFQAHDWSLVQPLRKVGGHSLYRLSGFSYKKLAPLLSLIYKEFFDKQEQYHHVIKASLAIFFIEIMRQKSVDHPDGNKRNDYRQDRLEEFLELLELHFTTDKQVFQYAVRMNLSVYQLNSIVKSLLDKTCSEVINDYIVLEAKRNLLATANQVTQIAFELGYDDVSYFIRFFKKHTGFSPDAFRSNFK